MKRLLIGCAALALIGAGQALAQSNTAQPNNPPANSQPDTGVVAAGTTAGQDTAPGALNTGKTSGMKRMHHMRQAKTMPSTTTVGAPSGTEAQRADTGSAGVGAQNGSAAVLNDGTTGGSTATAGSNATRMASTGGAIVGDMAQSNPAPGSYPPCTKKGQDRCVARMSHHHSGM